MQKNFFSSFLGNQIYSDFRKENILQKIKNKYPFIEDMDSIFLHIAESKQKLTSN